MPDALSGPMIGRSVRRLEDPALIRGQGRFLDDLTLPGLAHAAFLRSPVAHGRIRRIDADEARALPGVRAVLTLADLRPVLTADRLPLQFRSATLPAGITPFVLNDGEVVYVGETIALVVADSRAIAEDAAALIDLDIEELDPVADCRDALDEAGPRVYAGRADNVFSRFRQAYGDVDAGFAGAAHVLSLSLKQHRGGAHPIEGRGVVASFDRFADQLTVWSSTQLAHEARGFLIELLGRDENGVRVVTPDVGGGFGAKYLFYPEEIAVAAASLLTGLPIKWVEDRREHFLAAIQERDQYWDFEAAVDADGRLLAVRGRMVSDAGAYVPQGINLAYNASTAFPGPYVLPAYDLDVFVTATNKVPTIPVRGAGYPEGTFAMERLLDAIARELGLDRAEVRRRNLVPGEAMPYRTPMASRSGSAILYDSGDFPAIFGKALELIDYAGFETRRLAAAAEGRTLGIGIACGIKGTGRGPYESGLVRIGKSGRVSVYTGAMPMGQGLKTALAQITADQLGVAPNRITVVCGDTGTIPLGLGGFASRQTVTAGSSVHQAAAVVRRKVLTVASELLEAPEGDLELVDGEVRVKGTDRAITLKAVAEVVSGVPGYALPKGAEPGLEGQDPFLPTGLTYGMAAHAVEAEVDTGTGNVKLLRYVVVNDCGRAVNPMLVEGQIVGGVVHGIGNALFEWMGYDDRAQPITTTLAEYLLPTCTEIPPIEVHLVEYPSPLNPLGVKGVGEAGTVPAAAAIISAVEDALMEPGIRLGEVPLSPHRLFQIMRDCGRSV